MNYLDCNGDFLADGMLEVREIGTNKLIDRKHLTKSGWDRGVPAMMPRKGRPYKITLKNSSGQLIWTASGEVL